MALFIDLFSDNIFFKNNKFSGFIDFYFSQYFMLKLLFVLMRFILMEKQNLSFNVTKAKNLMNGYNEVRKLQR